MKIAMWSGPRNLSTAMMRAFENRADTCVVDEPLYAFYLDRTGLEHPCRDAVLRSQPRDWRAVTRALCAPDATPHAYQKHMTHHLLPDVGRGWLAELRHAFLIRDPVAVVASYRARRGDMRLADLGFVQQAELFDEVRDVLGQDPPVVDADDVLRDPRHTLSALCQRLGLPFDEAMLQWPAGPRPSDGVWAEHWYAGVWASTGFGAPRGRPAQLDGADQALADQARPAYEHLAAHRL